MAKKDKNEPKVIKMKPQHINQAPIPLYTGFSKGYSILIHTFQNHA